MLQQTIAPSGLITKLAAIMAAVERIPKRGHNDFHHYDYATEADIVSAIRHELASRHVMLLPAITGTTRDAVGEKGSVLTTLTMEMTFVDGETGETITRPWAGAGTDKEDKGLYKSLTGAVKYFLLKTFLIPTGDDPEQAQAAPPRALPARRPVPLPPPAPVVAPAVPGYQAWLMALVGVAAAGTKQLEAVWYASSKAYRQKLVDETPAEWDKLKARAALVVAS
jgi:hypothetical protein